MPSKVFILQMPGLRLAAAKQFGRRRFDGAFSSPTETTLQQELKQLDDWSDPAVYASLLQRCTKARALEEGKRLHARMARKGFDRDTYIANLLMQMYGNCGSLSDACAVFDKLRARNMYSWNLMVAAYAQNGHLDDARTFFEKMPEKDVVSWNAMMTICAQGGHLQQARSMFNKMPTRSIVSWNAMISAYAQNGHLEDARRLFGEMIERNVASWNNMIHAYVKHGDLQEARALFDEMPIRDAVSWTAMIQAYADKKLMDDAKSVFDMMENPDVISCTAMIGGYASIGKIIDAHRLFNRMPVKDTVSWNAMLQAYVQNGYLEDARNIFDTMPHRNVASWNAMVAAYAHKGQPGPAKLLFDRMKNRNVISWTAMVQAYAQAGQLESARMVFESTPNPNVVSWTTMITAYAQNGHGKDALELFRGMDLEGVKPTSVTYVSILDACAGLAASQEGRIIHAEIVNSGLFLEAVVGNSLIHMYGRCGRLEEARSVFDQMPERDVVSWNAMTAAYAKTGHRTDALRLFELMALDGSTPDMITFISILFTCSHVGLLDVGRSHFRSISTDYGLEPTADHYACMVDLLARAGQLDRAEELMNSMPFEPDDVAYTTLVVACRSQGEVGRAARGAKQILELKPERASGYVLLSNIHDDAAKEMEECLSAPVEVNA